MMAAAAKSQQEEKIKWDLEKVSMILHNRPFMVLQAASAFEMIRKITYEALPYLYDDVFGDYQMKAIIDIISGTFSYAGLFAVPFVGKKISARGMLMGGYAYTGILYIFMSLFNLGFDLENLRKKGMWWVFSSALRVCPTPHRQRQEKSLSPTPPTIWSGTHGKSTATPCAATECWSRLQA
ncbi:MAG: hypothetical protein GXY95_01730 [Clostridiales bacterium]|nr:hypothetical protein [Clostridiales bacterium]